MLSILSRIAGPPREVKEPRTILRVGNAGAYVDKLLRDDYSLLNEIEYARDDVFFEVSRKPVHSIEDKHFLIERILCHLMQSEYYMRQPQLLASACIAIMGQRFENASALFSFLQNPSRFRPEDL